MIILGMYILIFAVAALIWAIVGAPFAKKDPFTALKTVTFGDESAIRSNRFASVVSVIAIFLIWGSFTGSSLIPGFLHVPGPYQGETGFTYEATAPDGTKDTGIVRALAHPVGAAVTPPSLDDLEESGFAKNFATTIPAYRASTIIAGKLLEDRKVQKITSIDGTPIAPNGAVDIENGQVRMNAKGSLTFEPEQGMQMAEQFLPAPEKVGKRFVSLIFDGYQNVTLFEHLGLSLFRVLVGFLLGCLVGIPLGYAMGLNGWFRGWFDPIVEFMRPVPPLALIPLIIIWLGIWETGKISLLFLAALWIMAIAARSGVSGVRISKVHAAYSLGASKWQILKNVIVPNSLPDIFTGARVAMGVCWGTVVAAELVAAQKGAGKMIIEASKFSLTDIVIVGILLIGVVGFGIDILMRKLENYLIPWKGKG